VYFGGGNKNLHRRLVPMQYIYYPSTRPRLYETTRLSCGWQNHVKHISLHAFTRPQHCICFLVEPRLFAANKSPLNSFVREYPHNCSGVQKVGYRYPARVMPLSGRPSSPVLGRPTSAMVAKARCWVVRLAASNPPLSTLATSPWRECSGPSDQVRKILESSAALRVNQHLRN